MTLHPYDLQVRWDELFARGALQVLFQPVLNLVNGSVLGHEALIRGPSDSAWHAPGALFRAAIVLDRVAELDAICFETILGAAVERRVGGLVFINVSPVSLSSADFSVERIVDRLRRHGLTANQLVLELTECALPIQERIEHLLAAKLPFVIAYADLDHFKPYNDIYGFRQGDSMIRLVARLLTEVCDPQMDFVGHLGGDDFIVLFQSADWEKRCRSLVERFDLERLAYFTEEHRAAPLRCAISRFPLGDGVKGRARVAPAGRAPCRSCKRRSSRRASASLARRRRGSPRNRGRPRSAWFRASDARTRDR